MTLTLPTAATYESHVVVSRELHEAQQHLMKTKRAMQRLESDLREAKRELHEAQQHRMETERMMQRLEPDLREAKAAAVDATAAVDRKRKAAADAEDGFNSDVRLARHCYGLKCAAPALSIGDGGETPSCAPEPALKCHPVYSPVDPTYRGGETPTFNPYESQGGCETPTYAPTSASYVPQDPNCGGGYHHGSPIGYHPLTGVPQYKTRKMSPSFTPPARLRARPSRPTGRRRQATVPRRRFPIRRTLRLPPAAGRSSGALNKT